MDRPRQPLHSQESYIYPEKTSREYRKFFFVIIGTILVSLILTLGRGLDIKYVWEDFIAVYLILSAAYKMFRLEIFSKIYQSYDIIASRWKPWSYIFPFVELALGADYLLSNGSVFLYLATLVVMGVAGTSALVEPQYKSHVQYACLDTTIRLPLATISLIESILIFFSALIVLIFY